jgi:hypothetical protein
MLTESYKGQEIEALCHEPPNGRWSVGYVLLRERGGKQQKTSVYTNITTLTEADADSLAISRAKQEIDRSPVFSHPNSVAHRAAGTG